MSIFQNYHPKVIINDHFDIIKNQIDINIETLLLNQSLNQNDINILNAIRQKQIGKINEIEKYNFDKINLNEYEKKWSNIINDESIDYNKKIDILKEDLILNDCILIDNLSLKSNTSLWILPWYLKEKLKFIQNSKKNVLNKVNFI